MKNLKISSGMQFWMQVFPFCFRMVALHISRKNKKVLIKVVWFEYKINKIFESLCLCHDADVDKNVFFFHISNLSVPSLRHFLSHGKKRLQENPAAPPAKMQSQTSANGWIHGIVGRNISSVSLHAVTNESRNTIISNISKGTLILGGQLSKHRSV